MPSFFSRTLSANLTNVSSSGTNSAVAFKTNMVGVADGEDAIYEMMVLNDCNLYGCVLKGLDEVNSKGDGTYPESQVVAVRICLVMEKYFLRTGFSVTECASAFEIRRLHVVHSVKESSVWLTVCMDRSRHQKPNVQQRHQHQQQQLRFLPLHQAHQRPQKWLFQYGTANDIINVGQRKQSLAFSANIARNLVVLSTPSNLSFLTYIACATVVVLSLVAALVEHGARPVLARTVAEVRRTSIRQRS